MSIRSATCLFATILFGACWLAPASAQQEAKPEKSAPDLPTCPVMGDEPIDFTASLPTDDGPVFFCCKSCSRKYEKDPARFADAVKAQREMLRKRERVQVTCPLSGEPVDKKVSFEHDGQAVYFCCEDCKGKYAADPGKYAGKLEASYTYQTHCPVMGKKIDPASFMETAGGQRIYSCCDGCGEKLTRNPDKYIGNLHKQGYKFKPESLTVKKEEKP